MYQPATARWKSEDPFPPNGEPILLGRNPYEYAQNNPINRVDPSGLDSTPITVEGETYSVSESQDSFQNPGKGNRFIFATGIAEDAKAVFVALAVQGAVYRQGRDAAQSVMSALQKKEGVGNFTTKDFLRAMFGVDPDRLAQPEGLTECEREALIAAQESFREYEKALQETNRLFDKLGFDKLQLEGYTRAGSFPGTSNRGTGFNTALDIVQQWVPDPRDYDGIQSADLEVEIASLFIPIPGIGRLAGLAGRAATGVAA